MRALTAYFVGAGTVVVAIAAGLGGGLLLGNIMSPPQPKLARSEVTRQETTRREPRVPQVTAMNGTLQPVPYLAAPQAAAIAEPPSQPQASQPQQPPRVEQSSAQPARPNPQADARPAGAPQPAAAVEQPVQREGAASEDAYANAREADVKRETRRADDRRKLDRRQRWAERHKQRVRDSDELNDVEASVRQATESRPPFGRNESRPLFGGEPGFGRINLFESGD